MKPAAASVAGAASSDLRPLAADAQACSRSRVAIVERRCIYLLVLTACMSMISTHGATSLAPSALSRVVPVCKCVDDAALQAVFGAHSKTSMTGRSRLYVSRASAGPSRGAADGGLARSECRPHRRYGRRSAVPNGGTMPKCSGCSNDAESVCDLSRWLSAPDQAAFADSICQGVDLNLPLFAALVVELRFWQPELCAWQAGRAQHHLTGDSTRGAASCNA